MASYARDIWEPHLVHNLPISRLLLKQDGTAHQLKCACCFAKALGVLHFLINNFISSKRTQFLTKVWSEGIRITSKLKHKERLFFFLSHCLGFTVLFCSISLFCYHCLQTTKSGLTAESTVAWGLRVELHGTQGPVTEVWPGDGPISGAHGWGLRNGETPCFNQLSLYNQPAVVLLAIISLSTQPSLSSVRVSICQGTKEGTSHTVFHPGDRTVTMTLRPP